MQTVAFLVRKKVNFPNFYYHSVVVDDIHQAVEDGYINSQYIFTIGSDYFKEIAKMRAFVSLFETHFQGFPNIFAQTSLSNKESEEPYTNLLRTTTESMSAILGGCDALMIRPLQPVF
jgi:methylmalonyl-CoA mutase N-terminal domain/subunit